MFSSIRSKLLAILFILGVIPLLIVGYLSYQSASYALLSQTKEQLGNVADKTAQQIDNFFEVAKKDIELLSNFPFTQLSFLQFEFGQRLDTVKRLLEDYGKKNKYSNRIYLISLKGKTILAVPEIKGQARPNFNSMDWFRTTLNQGLYLSDLLTGDSPHNPAIMLTKLVYDFQDNTKPVGILAFDIKLSSFTNFVASLKIGNQGYAFLLNKRGYLIYHPDRSLRLKRSFIESGDVRLNRLIQRMKSGERGFGDYLFNKIEKYMVFTPCRIKNWSVGITLHKSELMADIYRLRRRMITFVSIIIGLILLVSFLFVRSLTHPIRQLITGARAVGSGDLDQVIEIKSNDELKGLAKEFNEMAAKLKNSLSEILELKSFNDDILRSVTSGIITVNKEGVLTSFNKSAEKIVGYTYENSNPKASSDLPVVIKEILDLLQKTLITQERILHHAVEISKGDDSTAFVDVNTSLLRNRKGQIIGAIADIRDITQRKSMEELMVRVDKLASLGELSAGVAHEIRNPLAGMKTSVQILVKKITTDSGKVLLDGILDEIDRLNKIVTDLLRFSRPSAPILASTDIPIILEKALDMVAEKIRKNRINLIRRYEEDLPRAIIDKEQIQQVFINLLLNAIKAMPEGGTLTTSVRAKRDKTRDREGDFIEISFKDTGHGIDKEDLPRIFNPFFTTDPNGTGLGLPIVHKLLEKNNGYIYLDSVEKKGSNFILLLPTEDLSVSASDNVIAQ